MYCLTFAFPDHLSYSRRDSGLVNSNTSFYDDKYKQGEGDLGQAVNLLAAVLDSIPGIYANQLHELLHYLPVPDLVDSMAILSLAKCLESPCRNQSQ